MKILRKIKILISLPLHIKWLFIEAFVMLGWARILKMMPFSQIAPSLGDHMEETEMNQIENKIMLKHVSEAIHIMSKYTIWESQCLVKAIAGMKMLQRRKLRAPSIWERQEMRMDK